MAAGTVVVVGSLNEDQSLSVQTIPRPGETVLATSTARSCGGKGANQAVAAARAGAAVRMVGRVGRDDAGERLLAALGADGIDVDAVVRGDGPTGIAVVTVAADGENAIVVAAGENAALTADDVTAALADLGPDDVLVTQGEIGLAAIEAALRAAARAGARAVLNLAPPVALDLDAVPFDVLVVNEHEAAVISDPDPGDPLPPTEQLAAAGALHRRLGAAVVVTLGAAGTVLATTDGTSTVAAFPAGTVRDTTGAGDAFVGALVAALAAGRDLAEAVRWGAAAGSIAVASVGAQAGRATPEAIAAVLA